MTEKSDKGTGSVNAFEYKRFLDEGKLPASILFYFADDREKEAMELVELAKSQKISVVTSRELDFRVITDESDRNLIREKIGEILIFPSKGLLEHGDAAKFLYGKNGFYGRDGIARAMFVFATREDAESVGIFAGDPLGFQLSGKPIQAGEMDLPGIEVFPRWLKMVKERNLKAVS